MGAPLPPAACPDHGSALQLQVLPRGIVTGVFMGVRFTALLVAGASLATATVPALASDPPAPRPVISVSNVATDPAHYAWISDDGRKALAGAIAAHNSGASFAFVFTAAPGGNYWNYDTATQQTDFVSIEDLARRSLETCEYFANAPCYIVSVNGLDARDAAGGLQIQPYLLASQPIVFDPTRVPLTGASSWSALAGYASQTRPKAMVVTYNGGWWWDYGDDIAKAVAAAYADCQKSDSNNVCLLYAVDNRVVFTASGPH
jgi:hypothetical protein